MLTNEDIARLDDRYVMQDDCDTRHSKVNDRQTQMEIDLAKIGTQLSTLIKILLIGLTPTVASLVAIAVKVLFGGA